MLGFIRTSDTSQTGLRCPCTPHPAFCPRISWLRRGQIVWLQWSSWPWAPLWTSHSRVTGPCVQSEPFAITWTGPQILGRTRSWSLSPSRKPLLLLRPSSLLRADSVSLSLEIPQQLHTILFEGCGLG